MTCNDCVAKTKSELLKLVLTTKTTTEVVAQQIADPLPPSGRGFSGNLNHYRGMWGWASQFMWGWAHMTIIIFRYDYGHE